MDKRYGFSRGFFLLDGFYEIEGAVVIDFYSLTRFMVSLGRDNCREMLDVVGVFYQSLTVGAGSDIAENNL